MTLHHLARCPIGAILILTAFFLCADLSRSFAMTASASMEEIVDAKEAETATVKNELKKAKTSEMENLKILRNKVIRGDFLEGDPDIETPSFGLIDGRKIVSEREDDFDEAMAALAENQGCIRDTSDLSTTWDLGNNWSVGPGASVQLLRYETKSGKAAINAMGLGLGLSARWFSDDNIDAAALVRKSISGGGWEAVRSIRRVHPDCRVSTFEQTATKLKDKKHYARSAFSLGLFAFVSKEAEQDTVKVDPAITVGFLQDLLTLGVGINTHGRNRGNAFLLIGLGSAFSLGD